MTRHMWSLGAAAAATLFALGAGQVLAVEYANIDVVDGAAPTNVNPPTASIPAGQKSAGFFVDPGSVVGEFPIRIGVSAADDAAGGVLIATPRETVRFPVDGPVAPVTSVDPPPGTPLGVSPAISTVRDDDSTSGNTRNVSGGLAIILDRAGTNQTNAEYPQGGPMNANIAAAYFSFSEGWKGGTAFASANNGPIDTFQGSAGITFSPTIGVGNTANVRPNYLNPAQTAAGVTPVVEPGVNNDGPALHTYDPGNPIHNGHHYVSIPGVSDTRQQGLLFGMHAKNEDNYATLAATADGAGWHLNTRGINQPDTNQGESDPFSFVFMPLGTPNVTMASMWGASSADNAVGPPVPILKSGANFQVTNMDAPNGRFRLTIDGQTPTSGVLLVGGGHSPSGAGDLPGDNVVTYTPDGDGWIIYSDDMASVNTNPLNGQEGQVEEGAPYFHFAFMPFNAAPGAPTIQPVAWDKSSRFGYNVAVTELDGADNNQNDAATGAGMLANVPQGTPGLQFLAVGINRGDNRIHVNGAMPARTDGMMFSTSREGFRDNSTTGGTAQYTIANSYVNGQNVWVTASSSMDPDTGENNHNYASALFGQNSGFQMGTLAAVTGGTGLGTVLTSAVGATDVNSGVLIANNADNEDNFVTVTVKSDGTGWDVQNWDNGSVQQNFSSNYIYLPYTTQNLVAGRVNPDGTLVNSTTTSGFTLTKDPSRLGAYLLTVAGKSPTTGMLLLDAGANGDVASSDNAIAYETSETDPSLAANVFRILTIDSVTIAEKAASMPAALEDSSFMFAYFDFANPPTLDSNFLEADFNEDGLVNGADLTLWRTNFGTGTTKATGNADGDADVDGNDFLVWQRQLGTFPAVAAAGAVPEPGALVLALGAVAGLVCVRRRNS